MVLRAAFAVVILGVAILGVTPATSAGPAVAVAIDVPAIEFVEDGGLVTPSIDGCRSLAAEGEPNIPARVVHFVIPSDMSVADIAVSFGDERMLLGTYRIAWLQPETPVGEERTSVDASLQIYSSDEIYPPERAVYLGDGYLGGYHIASIALYPLRYHPESGRVVVTEDLTARLELVPSVDRSAPRYRMTTDAADTYRRLVAGMVENPEDIAACMKPGVEIVSGDSPDGFAPRHSPSLEGSAVEYVIITTEEYEPYFQQIADWKTKKGVPAVIRTVSWINASTETTSFPGPMLAGQ